MELGGGEPTVGTIFIVVIEMAVRIERESVFIIVMEKPCL